MQEIVSLELIYWYPKWITERLSKGIPTIISYRNPEVISEEVSKGISRRFPQEIALKELPNQLQKKKSYVISKELSQKLPEELLEHITMNLPSEMQKEISW